MDASPAKTIRETVVKRLLEDSATKDAVIDVVVSGSKVELSGIVKSPAVKRSAETIAQGVAGVGIVINELEIQSGR